MPAAALLVPGKIEETQRRETQAISAYRRWPVCFSVNSFFGLPVTVMSVWQFIVCGFSAAPGSAHSGAGLESKLEQGSIILVQRPQYFATFSSIINPLYVKIQLYHGELHPFSFMSTEHKYIR